MVKRNANRLTILMKAKYAPVPKFLSYLVDAFVLAKEQKVLRRSALKKPIQTISGEKTIN